MCIQLTQNYLIKKRGLLSSPMPTKLMLIHNVNVNVMNELLLSLRVCSYCSIKRTSKSSAPPIQTYKRLQRM